MTAIYPYAELALRRPPGVRWDRLDASQMLEAISDPTLELQDPVVNLSKQLAH